MNFRNNFASNIMYLRKSNNLSLSALGNAIGVSNQAISLLEQGKRSPSFEVLIMLADHFNVSIDYLVGRSDKPEINK